MNAGACSMSWTLQSIYDEHLHVHMMRADLPELSKIHFALAG